MSKDFSDYKNRALFVHIPKTAGASMSSAPFILKHGSQGIAPNSEFIKSLPFRFSFVRNPYDRFASVVLNLGYATPETFEDFVLNEFPKRIKRGLVELNEQPLWSMEKYLYFNGKLEVDFLGHFENLLEDWEKVCKKIGYNFPLPHSNKSKYNQNYNKFYSLKTRKMIGEIYKNDFSLFGYNK